MMESKISEIMFRYDPGVLRPLGTPSDEYDSESREIVNGFREGRLQSVSDIENMIIRQLMGIFDKESGIDKDLVKRLSVEIWNALHEK